MNPGSIAATLIYFYLRFIWVYMTAHTTPGMSNSSVLPRFPVSALHCSRQPIWRGIYSRSCRSGGLSFISHLLLRVAPNGSCSVHSRVWSGNLKEEMFPCPAANRGTSLRVRSMNCSLPACFLPDSLVSFLCIPSSPVPNHPFRRLFCFCHLLYRVLLSVKMDVRCIKTGRAPSS